jgi:hypothetical protein
MDTAAQLLALAILATAEMCAEPLEGGVGDPQFCRIEVLQEISTPFFTITVEPHFLVGVHHHGRRLQIQSSIRQEQDKLIVEVLESSTQPDWNGCPQVLETVEGLVTWHDCRISTAISHERRLLGVMKEGQVLIRYQYSGASAQYAPALERMTQSIRIHAI